jgi:hypothetical protein
MKPIDYRNATLDQILERLQGQRLAVYEGLKQYGPCTTRELADAIPMSILSVRPRVTELCQINLAQLAFGSVSRSEGQYEARDIATLQERAVESDVKQLPLRISE